MCAAPARKARAKRTAAAVDFQSAPGQALMYANVVTGLDASGSSHSAEGTRCRQYGRVHVAKAPKIAIVRSPVVDLGMKVCGGV